MTVNASDYVLHTVLPANIAEASIVPNDGHT